MVLLWHDGAAISCQFRRETLRSETLLLEKAPSWGAAMLHQLDAIKTLDFKSQTPFSKLLSARLRRWCCLRVSVKIPPQEANSRCLTTTQVICN